MRDGARVAAAIEILSDIEARKRPAADAAKDWMLSHRFAGSKDRAEIGDLVFGALRWKQSSAWRLGEDTPRSWVFGAVAWGFARGPDWIANACAADPHAPPPPSEAEQSALAQATLDGAPDWVRGDFPEWLDASMARIFGEARAEEGAALAAPAPLDLRVNTLKSTRDDVIAALAESPRLKEPPAPTSHAPDGVRIPWAQGRTFPWAAEQSFLKGWFEVQDEGSQIAALLAGASPREQVLDLCAGAGGKTLAMAAAMQNKGQIYAYDEDRLRLKPIFDRVHRSGLRNIQILRGGDKQALGAMGAKFDRVLVDAPCTGSGTWRRRPDAKWKLKPEAVLNRLKEQREVLKDAARLVKPGGRLIYVTCSILPEENGGQVLAFLRDNGAFSQVPYADVWRDVLPGEPPVSADGSTGGLMLSSAKHGTDGFYISVLARAA